MCINTDFSLFSFQSFSILFHLSNFMKKNMPNKMDFYIQILILILYQEKYIQMMKQLYLKQYKQMAMNFFMQKPDQKKVLQKIFFALIKLFLKKLSLLVQSSLFLFILQIPKIISKKLKKNDEFIIESTFRHQDDQYRYYLCSLGFYLKINIFDEYLILDNTIQKEEKYDQLQYKYIYSCLTKISFTFCFYKFFSYLSCRICRCPKNLQA
eukprot:TRINITY_DN8155_c0_g1_i1.p1 TRINITY_DN8155_c0_g1~~TRINITY_DN8155_c0_g1_i1.p1  ORF type:complete len:210 (+),score=1.72 TRINITY_DN8155_c0_g1_i1:1-630(+)